jgi:serine/threonine protein kinase
VTAPALGEPAVFGHGYSLIRRLAVGGMAEIYLARQTSASGFEKDVVIKRLRPELVGDARIRDMFLDEGEVCALLIHPHTVHIYDVGEHDGVPFIAMEYIRGEELNVLCRRSLGVGSFLPLPHAVELIRQAALSLGHFHSLADAAGNPLGVVHCDISPTNLLVTGNGFTKVIDFGIARFRGQRYRDQAAVPGKLSYMSPEQARREPLDLRSDIYSLGVVLYEITVGRRLFKGPANEVIKRLSAGRIEPPTFVRQDYPGALDGIVMRTLEPDPIDRYQSAYDLADELQAFLLETSASTGPVAIARYLDELAVAAGGSRRPELISESELDDEDALDFDRIDWVGDDDAEIPAIAEWDEFEEDEQAVADALGIDVRLVRTQGRIEEPAPAPLPGSPPPAALPPIRPPSEVTPPPRAFEPPDEPSPPPRGDPAPGISPLPPPSPFGPMLIGIAIGGVIAFLVLHFLV